MSEKAEFYNIANQFSSIIKSLIGTLNDSIIISDKITEHGSMFEHWKNSNEYDCFNNLCNYIKKRNSYSLVLPDDNNIVDFIIENILKNYSGFRLEPYKQSL